MKINYLGATAPLTKTFEEIAPGTYKETPYPFISHFTSIEKQVTSLDEFYQHTVAAANEGLCLLKGTLDKPLRNESRAGHTDATHVTEWLCLDVDYTVIDRTPEQFLDDLNPAFAKVSFFFQYSASTQIKTHQGWRGHFFVLLAHPLSPQLLKQWLIACNLSNAFLSQHIKLSANGGALIYPLDVTTCQNDKLLYIAPPTCVGFADPIGDRFKLYSRKYVTANLDLSSVSAAHNSAAVNNKVADLRATSGLPKKAFKIDTSMGHEILLNPDAVTVTGKKEARDFVYLNLNGGDSWGYFFPRGNPEILFNFKGEPCLYMRDVDKDIYNEYIAQPQSVQGAIPFGFLWPADDCYYRGFANPNTQELAWIAATNSKDKLRDFFLQNNVPMPKKWSVEEWQLKFDPTIEGVIDFDKRFVNTFKRSVYLRNVSKVTDPTIPPTVDRILNSVCVDIVTKQHFLNWLAFIFQTRKKANTAWVLQGTQGTGKGVLFYHVLSPLLGATYCHQMTMDRLDDDFNAYLSSNILLFIDEANIGDSRNGERLLNRIKNLVTEPIQHIRAMRRNAVVVPNFSNIILASNHDEIISIDSADRRFNIAPRQEKPIKLEYADIKRLETELQSFANLLHSYAVDQEQVNQVLLTDARAKLVKLSETTVDSFFLAIRKGDLSYFTQYLDNNHNSADIDGIRYHEYALTVKNWMNNVGKTSNVSRNELRICYQYLQSTAVSASKFTRMAAKYNLEIKPIRIDNQLVRGIHEHTWHLDEAELKAHQNSDATHNVVRLRK